MTIKRHTISHLQAVIVFAAFAAMQPSIADVPRVATDITPVHSLVARVMDGIGSPGMLIAQGASPHEYSLRPSEARLLQDAELVFWVGEDLSPWLVDAIENLASDATVVELIETEHTITLPTRQSALFEAHSHDHDADEHHDEHHDELEAHHEDDVHAHANASRDPHVWLSPDNAGRWLELIAMRLADADPGNADVYRQNALAGQAELSSVISDIETRLSAVRGRNFVVFHDAYQYFEHAFDIHAAGAISISDASDPSPARVAEIQRRVAEEDIRCLMSEPQYDPGIVAAVMQGSPARTGILDPLGTGIETGPGLYQQILIDLAKSLTDCLSDN